MFFSFFVLYNDYGSTYLKSTDGYILTEVYLLEQICGQSYKHFMLVNYDYRVVIWGIFQSGTTQES